jgi:hypothetical protein
MNFNNEKLTKDLPLFNYLELLISTNKNKVILVSNDFKLGVIVIRDKRIVFSIDYLGNKGNKAFYNICSWKDKLTFKEIYVKEFIEDNIDYEGNILLSLNDDFNHYNNDDLDNDLSEIEFDCKYSEIQKIFIKNKVHYIDLETENKLVKDIINGLIVDYNIETLVVLKKEGNKNKIIALHNCDVIDFCDLLHEVFESIIDTISDKKFSFVVNQYQIKLENNKIIIFEQMKNTDYFIGLLFDIEMLSTGVVLNVFLPLLKEELLKILHS